MSTLPEPAAIVATLPLVPHAPSVKKLARPEDKNVTGVADPTVATLPYGSSARAVTTIEQTPATTLRGRLGNTRREAFAAVTVRVCMALDRPRALSVTVGIAATGSLKKKRAELWPVGIVID